ncbi:unnamed protein product [Orchesella dallaii]|uniref:Transmembrane protein n=1 Tax=Orchesella dallaii TaxID=48710 RepID=A0ABP1S364_9HEXA
MEVERSCDGVQGQSRGGRQECMHSHVSAAARNIEIDWREVDPYFSELSDCASFWTLINFTCDVIYSGLFVLFFIMGQDVESMFFEGLLNHINPILVYLILSLIINYGALRSLRCGRERCFLVFSISKAFLFPITIALLIYLVFCDVQEYFGTFWISFVVIISCYNGTAALGLWSMFTCNKYILVNEANQKRLRKQAKEDRSTNFTTEPGCRCGLTNTSAVTASTSRRVNSFTNNSCDNNQTTTTTTFYKSSIANVSAHHERRNDFTGESSRLSLVFRPETSCNIGVSSSSKAKCSVVSDYKHGVFSDQGCGTSTSSSGRRLMLCKGNNGQSQEDPCFSGDQDVLQISTVDKVMQEIRLLDAHNFNRDAFDDDDDDGDSL